MRAIILAAGRGSRMGSLTDDRPKCLTIIKGKSLIEYQIAALTEAGIKDIAIVTGYKSEMLTKYGSYHFHNERWKETNMVFSLLCAKEWLDNYNCIVSYSDIYYDSRIVKDLIACPNDIAVAYDPNWLAFWSKRFENPLNDAETFRIDEDGHIIEIGQRPKTIEEIQGQYMGLLKIKRSKLQSLFEEMKEPIQDRVSMTSLLNKFVAERIKSIPAEKFFEVDSFSDYELINRGFVA